MTVGRLSSVEAPPGGNGVKRYAIQGRDGLDVVRFGEARALVTPRLGDEPGVFRTDGTLRDYFCRWGMSLYYDDRERLDGISVEFGPEVYYEDVQLLGRSYEDVSADLTALGLRGEEGRSGVVLEDRGFAVLGAPDDPLVHTWGVEIFPPGGGFDVDAY